LILTEEPLVKRLLATLPAPADVLDVATGTGRWALYLAEHGARVVGIDESPEMLAVARAKARAANLPIRWVEGALEDGLPFPPERFDLVVCALALCHVLDLHQAIAVCSRVLRPGGSLLITDFHPQAIHNGWRTMIVGSGDVYTIPNAHHSVPAYLDAIRESGCEVVHVEQVLVRDQPQEAMLTSVDLTV
jgi:ubiquinone/menaquinone biosynthesis C-methylase UbiE